MKEYRSDTKELKALCPQLRAGDRLYLSGTVYTARDAAHKRIFELLSRGESLPFEIDGAVIYYAGPTPTPKNAVIGSCGPTTSGRMDSYTPTLYNMGLTATIGKGERSEEVVRAVAENSAVYLCAIGGAGALAALSVTECEVIAFEDLGCESVKRLEFKNFPLIVGVDCRGGSVFNIKA